MGYNNDYKVDSYYSNSYKNGSKKECDCDSFFKNISRGEEVKVFLKGGGHVSGEFIDVRGNLVYLAKADCHRHEKCKCDDERKVKISTICCDDIVAVEV
ncbi:hypothetical protein [Shouchella patagoniensis]|uniref:hypothetical protein n=1 Tax=Shouchella patagoniensis TaxID=228576 RepID=UPI000995BFA1|nr:hypothetical protein [Shouchella patagoniensis]